MANNINETTAIANLQRYLNQLALEDSDYLRVAVDGIFEEQTAAALREFQGRMGLQKTGVADKETWDTLFREYQKSLVRSSTPESVNLFPRVPEGYEIESGDTGALVTALQYMLLELSIIYDLLEKVVTSGSYDAETVSAVKEFQRRNNLSDNGKVDLATWNAIVNQYNKFAYPYQI